MPEIGYCGDDCNLCPRYRATQSGDTERLKEIAAIWQMLGWRHTQEPPEKYLCHGCETIGVCGLGVKDCAVAKGIDSCGKCADYPCKKLEKTFENNKLEAISCRQTLSKEDFNLFQKAFFTKKERLDEIHRKTFQENNVVQIMPASIADAAEILKLQKLAYISEAEIYHDYSIPPLTQTLEEISADFKNYVTLKAISNGVIIGSVKGQLNDAGDCYIGRLMVHPDFQHRGIGTRLLHAIEAAFPQVKRYMLGTGHKSEDNLRLYQKLGYQPYNSERLSDSVTIIQLEKINR